MGLIYMLSGLGLFFGAHLWSAFRARTTPLAGPAKGIYSLISLAGFGLMIWGYVAMRPSTILYTPPDWGRHVNYALMLVALILLASAYLPAGRIKKVVKHPMLAAVKIWALGHLLSNGELNSVLLFGSFLAYGVIDRIAVKRRGDLGPAALARQPALWDLASVGIGAAAYGLIGVALHRTLFGVVAMG